MSLSGLTPRIAGESARLIERYPYAPRTAQGAVECLDLALFVDRQHDGVGWWIDIEPDDLVQLGGELWIIGQLKLAHPMRLQAVLAPDALH